MFGVWTAGGGTSGVDTEVARLTYFGLYALQHRGQESAGIAVSNGSQILVYKDMGLVAQVFDEGNLSSLRGHLAIGHTRYSTTGASVWENAQPTFRSTAAGSIALGHNGNLTNTAELLELVEKLAADSGQLPYDGAAPTQGETHRWRQNILGHVALHSTTDTEIVTALLASYADRTLEQAALAVLPTLRGAFSLVFMNEGTLYAARDPQGIRPLVLGRLDRGWVVASETAALDIVGAAQVREIEPGELIAIDEQGLRSQHFAPADPKGCLFEYVYLARPDTRIAGRSVHATRVEVGRRLAVEAPAEADLVIPVPESGTPAAVGYSQGSGIPYGLGLVKNSYVGRTFIQPSQTIRQLGIRLKLNPLREVIAGQRLVVVDDSIVRGNTQRALVRMLREAGAAEVHVRIASPPVKWPCFYGIDFASPGELIANGLAVEEIRASIDADSLAYISLDGLVAASEQPLESLCRACFDGVYPVALPEPDLLPASMLDLDTASSASVPPMPGGALLGHDSLTPGHDSFTPGHDSFTPGHDALTRP